MNKITVQLSGQDGNVFNLMGIVTRALNRAGQPEQAKELMKRLPSCGSYDEALQLFMEYVDVE